MSALKFTSVIVLLLIASCGGVQNLTLGGGDDLEPSLNAEGKGVFFFATDFISAGQLMTASYDSASDLTEGLVSNLGSGAVLRAYGDLLYVLHDGFSVASSDNVQIIDPLDDYKTVAQYSTGNFTNPHDIVVVGNKAYITLYHSYRDPANRTANGLPGDLIVMDLTNGQILKRLSFEPYLNNDASKTARADCLTRAGNFLYVCIQDLEGDLFAHNAPGKIGVIHLGSDSIAGVFQLKGRNPVDLVYSEQENKLFVALQAPFDYGIGNFNTALPYGGLEIIPLDDALNTILIDDEDLGGYIERLATDGDEVVLVASTLNSANLEFTSQILKMPASNETAGGVDPFIGGSSDVREIAIDPNGRLWVSRRSIVSGTGEASDPQVEVFGLSSGQTIGEALIPIAPITSIAFIE